MSTFLKHAKTRLLDEAERKHYDERITNLDGSSFRQCGNYEIRIALKKGANVINHVQGLIIAILYLGS